MYDSFRNVIRVGLKVDIFNAKFLEIQKARDFLMHNRTTFVVSHRLYEAQAFLDKKRERFYLRP